MPPLSLYKYNKMPFNANQPQNFLQTVGGNWSSWRKPKHGHIDQVAQDPHCNDSNVFFFLLYDNATHHYHPVSY